MVKKEMSLFIKLKLNIKFRKIFENLKRNGLERTSEASVSIT